MPGPDVHVNCVEDGKERETPANSINDDLLAAFKELVDDSAEEEQVDKRPGSMDECASTQEWAPARTI